MRTLNQDDVNSDRGENASIGCFVLDPQGSDSSNLSWYAIHTKAREEDRAGDNLRAWNVETFTPKIRERSYNQFALRPTYEIKHLFPRYIFARFALNILQKIRFTRGVQDIVGFGHGPALIDDEIIEIIKSRLDSGFVRIDDDLKAGDEVIIKDGPLKSFVGIFKHQVGSSDRVLIMLTTVSYQARVVINRDGIASVESKYGK
jgi:transcription elongation factor/antiterminator RfaH